jgi:membrane protein implicated in regulation of membrane protease activity
MLAMAPTGIYLGLLVYGAGVLLLSMLGALGHGHDANDGHEGHEGHDGHDAAAHDAAAHDAAAHDAAAHDAAAHDAAAHDGSHGHDAAAHDDGHGHDRASAQRPESSIAAIERPGRGESGSKAISRIASVLRSTVYLSLGAGATGLFAASRGLGALEGGAWAIGAGVLALAAARIVRRVARRDLDSSFRREEFLLEEGVVMVPAAGGEMGKAEVRKYGASVELYVKAADPSLTLAKGDRVRIVDCGEECYLVEPAAGSAGDQEA